MSRFIDKVVLITGASRGIGKAVAERFAFEGAKLAIIDNDEKELQLTNEEFRSKGYVTLPLHADISDSASVELCIQETVRHYSRIDILINNAGIAWEEDFLQITDAHWRKMIDVNLNGMFYVAQRAARQMVEQDAGIIINMSSTNGIAGEAKYAHYNASKAGIILLTKTMAVELGQYQIRVNAVCPGYIQTPMSEAIDSPEFIAAYIRDKIPLGRVGKPQDIAGVFAFLASEDAAFITGETITVDGGQLAL